jgi:LemA protein
MSIGGYIGIIIGVIVILWVIIMYNRLIELRNRVRNSWSQVDIVLKNRFDLIPNLIETVSGYAGYEKSTLNQLTELRTKYASASSVTDKASTSSDLSAMLSRVMVVAEGYPDLKASANYLYLKEQLTEIEDKIRYARQFYNDSVEIFNTAIAVFPSNLLAGTFGFREESFFTIDEAEKVLPKVQFKH